MTKFIRIITLSVMCLILGSNLIFPALATNENQKGILCISHRGDTSEYEGNTTEAVLSAFEKGADFVSVNIRKTSDGKLVLCGENKSDVNGDNLSELLGTLGDNNILILDFEADLKNEIYNLIKSENAFSKVILRINDSAKNITEWLEGKSENLQVIGIYDSFVVFTAASHIKSLSNAEMKFVQYQSKNYFNEMFGSFVSKTIKAGGTAKAIVATYSPDLCGQRSDSEDGWNDLIKKGFSVIETNNLNAFIAYIQSNEDTRLELKQTYLKAKEIETEKYNTVSKENLEDALEIAEKLLSSNVSSNDELQSSISSLRLSMDNLALKSADDAKKGALNITAGKVIAAVSVGAVILTAQIYTYKKQKR